MNLKLTAVFIVAAAAVAVIGWKIYNAPARRVARVFARAAGIAEKPADEGLVATAAKLGGAGALLADEIRVVVAEVQQNGAIARDEFVNSAFLVRKEFRTLTLTFEDLETAFPDDKTAESTCRVTLAGEVQGQGRVKETRDLKARLVENADGDWQFTALAAGPVIGK